MSNVIRKKDCSYYQSKCSKCRLIVFTRPGLCMFFPRQWHAAADQTMQESSAASNQQRRVWATIQTFVLIIWTVSVCWRFLIDNWTFMWIRLYVNTQGPILHSYLTLYCMPKNSLLVFTALCFSNGAVMPSLDVRLSVCDVGEQWSHTLS